jgi:carbamoyltransferase
LFRQFYSLLPDGNYVIQTERLMSLFKVLQPRRKWEPLTQVHKDIAASLQEALEDVVFHVIRHYQQKTKERNLCLAGGVAHNCTLNGKILSSGLFENVFVQPAAHDAGGALGAALVTYYLSGPKVARAPALKHVFWGTDIGDDRAILKHLLQWQSFIDFHRDDNISETVAGLISSGSVIGWAQGRAEFGPRALGNRSILADPRPVENKDKINQMVKKREGYRPFAPSVLEEDADEYFDIPNKEKQLPFMIFVVKVKEDKRDILGAVTHVDGTARAQTVSRETNEKFWRLIHAFKAITGIPILLNTSFNNNVEPIVDSVEDAIVCFLTTKLDYLVTGDYLITKKEIPWQAHLSLKPSLAAHITLNQVKMLDLDCIPSTHFLIRNSYDSDFQYALSPKAYQLLMSADGIKSIEMLIDESCKLSDEEAGEIVQELLELWSQRLIILRP